MIATDRLLRKTKVWLGLAVLLALAHNGCNFRNKPEFTPLAKLTTPELFDWINDNNARIRNLRSRLDIRVELPDEKHHISGHLFLRKRRPLHRPQDLLIKCSDTFGAAEFQLGSNSQGYWYILDAPRTERVYSFVTYNGDGSDGPANRTLDILSVLGVYELPSDLSTQPWPVCRGYEVPPYYVISFIERTVTGAMSIRREIWWNRQTHRVDRIALFNEQGEGYLSASLDDYRLISGVELATKIQIVWFEEELNLRLVLKDVEVNSTNVTDKNFKHDRPKWAPSR